MKKWDGICGDLQYIGGGDLYKSDDGTIYYKNDKGIYNIWCVAERLRRHLMRLYQICGDSTIKFLK